MTARRAILALLAVLATIVVVHITNDDGPRAPSPVTIAVDGPDADTKQDDRIVLSDQAEAELERGATATDQPGDTHRELADPLRESIDPSTLPPGKLEGPLAAQEFPGCRTRFVGNFSSRNGTPVRIIVWHQTVSRERGWASQDGLTALADRRSSGVSWALLIGRSEGRCTYTVPLTMKAWTQANANPFSVGIEVEAYGDEATYVAGPGERKLLDATREIGRRFDIPMRRGSVQDCQPVRSGIVEHADLGRCGGGHVDVASTAAQRGQVESAGWDIGRLIAKLGTPTSVDKVTCRKLNWWRAHGRPHGLAEQRAVRRRRVLDSRNVRCTPRGPVKAT